MGIEKWIGHVVCKNVSLDCSAELVEKNVLLYLVDNYLFLLSIFCMHYYYLLVNTSNIAWIPAVF